MWWEDQRHARLRRVCHLFSYHRWRQIDVICDLLLNRWTAKCNLIFFYFWWQLIMKMVWNMTMSIVLPVRRQNHYQDPRREQRYLPREPRVEKQKSHSSKSSKNNSLLMTLFLQWDPLCYLGLHWKVTR